MIEKTLGKHGPKVSCIGFGGWGIGGKTPGNSSYGKTDNDQSINTIKHAYRNNIVFFDTSPAYGDGVSESLIGEALEENRKKVIYSTKVGFSSWAEGANFNIKSIYMSLEASLERLRTNYIDVLWLHSPPGDIIFKDKSIFDLLDELKEKNIIKQWGVSCKSPDEGLQLLKERNVDLLQINFNMMDIRAYQLGLLDLAYKKGVGIVARTPLCFGFLTGKITQNTIFPEGDHRHNWSSNQIKTWVDGAESILSLLGINPGAEACKAALKFCLSFPSICVVLPGSLFENEVDEQVQAGIEGAMDGSDLYKIIKLHDKISFYNP